MDKVLKQRLVGASILIALAVIFLPMLFDSGADDAAGERELALDLPEREAGDRQVRRLPLDPEQVRRPPSESQVAAADQSRAQPPRTSDPSAMEPDPVETREPQPEQTQTPMQGEVDGETDASEEGDQAETSDDAAGPAAQEPGAGEDESPRAEPEASEAPSSSPASVPAEGRWMVQVAVFSSRETANSIRQRLDELGHRVSMDVLVRNQSELYRLRTGPYGDESAAEQARSQISTTVAGVDPVTRELSGAGEAEERRGLAVQVGSFASHNNAERLVGQLTGAGYDAFMYGEETGGRTIWRVRVGSYESREEAERLLETLREERGLEGIVVSHP